MWKVRCVMNVEGKVSLMWKVRCAMNVEGKVS